jgi:hypothetical protein
MEALVLALSGTAVATFAKGRDKNQSGVLPW